MEWQWGSWRASRQQTKNLVIKQNRPLMNNIRISQWATLIFRPPTWNNRRIHRSLSTEIDEGRRDVIDESDWYDALEAVWHWKTNKPLTARIQVNQTALCTQLRRHLSRRWWRISTDSRLRDLLNVTNANDGSCCLYCLLGASQCTWNRTHRRTLAIEICASVQVKSFVTCNSVPAASKKLS